MGNKILSLIVAATFAVQTSSVWAESQLFMPPPPPPQTTPPTGTTAPVTAPTTTNTPAATPQTQQSSRNPVSTINNGSKVGQDSQKSGSGSNGAAGAALIAAGAALLPNPPTMPVGAMLIALGILAMKQKSEDDKAAGQSGATGAASAFNNGNSGSTTNPDTITEKNETLAKPAEKGSSGINSPEVKKALAQIQAQGYDVTDKGIKTPDGKTLPMDTFKSMAAMQAAGIDPAVLSKVAEINKTLAAQEYGVSSVPVASGGGGGGSELGVDGEGAAGDSSSSGRNINPFNMDDEAKKALLAGKSVNLDGEPIGLRGMNIFDMIHSAYQKKRTGDQFYESEEVRTRLPARAPASTWMPASVQLKAKKKAK